MLSTLPHNELEDSFLSSLPIPLKNFTALHRLKVTIHSIRLPIFLNIIANETGTSHNILKAVTGQKHSSEAKNQICLIAQAYKARQYLSLSYQLRSHCYDSGLISLSRQNIEETLMVKQWIFLLHFLP